MAVMLFRQRVFLPVVMQRTQVDMRSGVIGIDFEHLLVHFDGLRLMVGVFLQRDAARKQLSRVGRRRFRATRYGSTGHEPLSGSEVKHELAGDGFDHFALVTEGDAVSGGEGASF